MLVELLGFPLYDLQRALGAMSEARAQSVAIYFSYHPRLAVDYL